MANFLEIVGISLQIFAGLIFILDQLAHKFSTSIEAWVGRVLGFLSGQGTRRRWRIITLLSLVALPAIIITILILGTDDEITWGAVGGILFFTVLGFDVYAIALAQFGRRFTRGDFAKHIQVVIKEGLQIIIKEGRILSSNVFLLVIAFVWLVIAYFVQSYLYLNAGQRMPLQMLFLLYFLLTWLVFLPILIFSLVFVSLELFVRFICLLGRIKPAYFWIAILVAWLGGGACLLINAI